MRKKVVKNAQCAEKSYVRAFYAKQKINLSCTQDTIFCYLQCSQNLFYLLRFLLTENALFSRKHNSKTECEEKLEKFAKEKLVVFAKLKLKN